MYDSITIITDCFDDNARGRQVARYASFFPSATIQLLAVKSDIQAAGFLLDICDSFLDGNHLVVVNVAPRHGEGKKWENGTPFSYFEYDGNLILSSIDGYTLSLVKKLQILKQLFVVDIQKVLEKAFLEEEISEEELDYIKNTQFRSFEFLPRLAIWLAEKTFDIPSKKFNIEEIPELWSAIWHIDNFGNCKTTMLASEFNRDCISDPRFEEVTFRDYLRHVEPNEMAFVKGSSGFDTERFIEIVKNGGDAADELNVYIGDEVK